jgi:hypothetical protein
MMDPLIANYIEKHRSRLLLCFSFRDAAILIAQGLKCPEADIIYNYIESQLHARACGCRRSNHASMVVNISLAQG